MRLPKEKLIFVVDTMPVGQFPGRGMIDFYPLETEAFIKKVLAMDWDRMIPGHPGAGRPPRHQEGRPGPARAAAERLGGDEEAGAAKASAGTPRRRNSSCPNTRTGPATQPACRSSPAATAACGAAAPERGDAGLLRPRRPPAAPDRLPPGQFVTDDFPVLSAGPTPRVEPRRLDVHAEIGRAGRSRHGRWAEFNALPQTRA